MDSFLLAKGVSLSEHRHLCHLENEIAILKGLDHENIVQCYGTEKDGEMLYIFLELVSQGTLEQAYKNCPFKESQVSHYTRQILQGLRYLHSCKVVHGDLKCADILVTESGRIKLVDFGLSKSMEDHSQSLKLGLGSSYWMAPEVANRKRVRYGFPSDIWSLGCTVTEMSTRKYPQYNARNAVSLDRAIRSGKGPVVPNYLSDTLKDFINQCLQPHPKQHPTAADLLAHPFDFINQCLQPDTNQRPTAADLLAHHFFHPRKLLLFSAIQNYRASPVQILAQIARGNRYSDVYSLALAASPFWVSLVFAASMGVEERIDIAESSIGNELIEQEGDGMVVEPHDGMEFEAEVPSPQAAAVFSNPNYRASPVQILAQIARGNRYSDVYSLALAILIHLIPSHQNPKNSSLNSSKLPSIGFSILGVSGLCCINGVSGIIENIVQTILKKLGSPIQNEEIEVARLNRRNDFYSLTLKKRLCSLGNEVALLKLLDHENIIQYYGHQPAPHMDVDERVDMAESSIGNELGEHGGELAEHEGDDMVVEPHEGMVFDSEDAAKIFYDEYARQIGFVMRVMSCRRSERDGRILARRLGCNKEGYCVSIRGKFGNVRKPRPSTREGCKAMIHVKFDKSGKWVITKFVKDHNHPLVVAPREARQTLDEKDKKIQELTAELRNKKRLCATYQEQLAAFVKIVEDHSEKLSKKVKKVVENLKEFESIEQELMPA
uniref:Protein kinase domain-containing protein n=1 Tax=Salix viminalis TaxID=40686 RepID=A0A6N2MF60_SALVM